MDRFFGPARIASSWIFVSGAMYLGFLGAAVFLFIFADARSACAPENSGITDEQFSDTATLPTRDSDRNVRDLLRRDNTP